MTETSKPFKPGESALKNMKLLKRESTVFKVPKIPKKKNNAKNVKILDEDVYVQGIAKIIQRDFFPDLEKLQAQNEFLEATENKDYVRLREITAKYNGNRPPTEPYNSPATFDTPGIDRPYSPAAPTARIPHRTESIPDSEIEKQDDVTHNHTLDSYLARHTSEDNASYDRVIALEDKKKSSKLVSQLMAEQTSAALVEAALMLPSIERQADQTERPHELDTWKYKAKNYIMYVPDGAKSQLPPAKAELVHSNTRLHGDPFDHARDKETINAIAKSHGANVSGKIGVDGVSITSEQKNGEYELVATPSPRPGDGPDQSPLMTWGEIEGTPFRLDGGDTPLPGVGAGMAYRMLEGGARERIALQLAEQAAKRRRPTTPRVAPTTPSFRTNTERLASMSPAARKLAAKHLLSPRLKLTPNNIGIPSHPFSPGRTPQRRPLVATPSSRQATPNARLATPKRNKKLATPGLTNAGSPDNNLTDNLLQINVSKRSRLKAQDFFK